ncbi:hypothetical protein AAMO2058_000163800 [Amorphochlora amoebiformis]
MSQIDLRGGGLFFLMASICSRGCITLVFEPIQTQIFRALTANRILGGKAFLFLGTATIIIGIGTGLYLLYLLGNALYKSVNLTQENSIMFVIYTGPRAPWVST